MARGEKNLAGVRVEAIGERVLCNSGEVGTIGSGRRLSIGHVLPAEARAVLEFSLD
jgi:hypothetical protein